MGNMFNQGQVCCAGSRLFVQKKAFDNAVANLVSYSKNIKQGPGLEPSTQMGLSFLKRSKIACLTILKKGKQKALNC